MDGMNVPNYVDQDMKLKWRESEEEEAQQLAYMEAADMGGGGMTISISTKRRRRLCKKYARGRRP